MKASDRVLTFLAGGVLGALGAVSWRSARAGGERLGDGARTLGIRRHVAEENLAAAFPKWDAARRDAVLREHYRELGRVAAEYAHLDRLARRPLGETIVEARGMEHAEAIRGQGAVIMSGHYSNFELLGAWLTRMNPVDFVVRRLSNPGVERMIARRRAAAGVGSIDAAHGTRRIYEALKAGHWVAFLADQDARRRGVFVPFFGRPASTAVGPARVALRTGAPLVMGFLTRRVDGAFDLDVHPPLGVQDPGAPDAALRLTAMHTAILEQHVRARPELWFWLHRRWKTRPPDHGAPARGDARA
jgi:KDO2-lipid IV(A) lauroyltransferase